MTPVDFEAIKWTIPTIYIIFGAIIFFKFIVKMGENKDKEVSFYKQIVVLIVCGPGAWLIMAILLFGTLLADIEPYCQKMIDKVDAFLFTEKKG